MKVTEDGIMEITQSEKYREKMLVGKKKMNSASKTCMNAIMVRHPMSLEDRDFLLGTRQSEVA